MDHKKLIFIHIPKTAGTSFKKILIQNYPSEETGLLYKPGVDISKDELSGEIRKGKSLILGHIPWGSLPLNEIESYNLLCFLRLPVDQVISHFIHFKTKTTARKSEYKEMEFEEFLTTNRGSNWQSQCLSSFRDKQEAFTEPEVMMREAIDNLENEISFCGLSERFDESLILIKERFNLQFIKPKKANVSELVDLKRELKQNFSQEIMKANEADYELYKRASEILDKHRKKVFFYFLKSLKSRF